MVQRWRLEDPADPNPDTRAYVFPYNPTAMTSVFSERGVTYQQTTAIDGQPIMWEAQVAPAKFSFSGTTLDPQHYEALRSWTYDRQGWLFLWDHYGRRLTVVLTKFNPEPKPAVPDPKHYWLHGYTVDGWVRVVTAPTVGV